MATVVVSGAPPRCVYSVCVNLYEADDKKSRHRGFRYEVVTVVVPICKR